MNPMDTGDQPDRLTQTGKRPLDSSSSRTPLSKRPNRNPNDPERPDVPVPETDTIRIEVSKVKIVKLTIR